MPTVNTMVEVDVELDDFYDDDLIEECEKRGLLPKQNVTLVSDFYDRYRLGKVSADEVTEFIDKIIYMTLGKII